MSGPQEGVFLVGEWMVTVKKRQCWSFAEGCGPEAKRWHETSLRFLNAQAQGIVTPVLTDFGCQLDYIPLEWTESQAAGYTCEGVFLKSFEVGRPTFNPDLLKWENPSIILATSSAGSLHKGYGEEKEAFFFACLFLLEFIPSLESASSGFWRILKTS